MHFSEFKLSLFDKNQSYKFCSWTLHFLNRFSTSYHLQTYKYHPRKDLSFHNSQNSEYHLYTAGIIAARARNPAEHRSSGILSCSGHCPEVSLLPHYSYSCWYPLASCSSQNKFKDCYYRFQGIAFPTAILSRHPCPTVCAHVITAIIFFLVNMHSLTKNCNGKVQVFLIRCLGHLE